MFKELLAKFSPSGIFFFFDGNESFFFIKKPLPSIKDICRDTFLKLYFLQLHHFKLPLKNCYAQEKYSSIFYFTLDFTKIYFDIFMTGFKKIITQNWRNQKSRVCLMCECHYVLMHSH